MPPQLVDATGTCATWKHSRGLTNDEIDLIDKWLHTGRQQGDPKHPTPATEPPRTPPLRNASVMLDTGAEFTPDLGPRATRCFVVDPALTADSFLAGLKVQPSNKRLVQQVTLFSLESEDAERRAAELDAQEPSAGYLCYGDPKISDTRLIAAWSWGRPVLRLPAGTGIRLQAGRKIVMLVRYNLMTGGDFPVRTRVALELADDVQEAHFMQIRSGHFALPPGQNRAVVTAEAMLTQPTMAYGVFPHMHTFGRTMKLQASGTSTACMAQVNHWQNRWQALFQYEEPLFLKAGTRLTLGCTFSTSGLSEPLTMGDGASQEECVAHVYAVPQKETTSR